MARERMGTLRTRSGAVLVIDMGLLDLWSHDREPNIPEGVLSEEARLNANSGPDFIIEGKDATRAAELFNHSVQPPYELDVPTNTQAWLRAAFAERLEGHGLDARLRALPGRVPHRDRVALALAGSVRGGIVQFAGVWAVATAGLPTARDIPVFGERVRRGENEGRYSEVHLEVAGHEWVESSQLIGKVMVDKARLMFVDPDALGAWVHDRSLDGKADFVFWGRDAAEVARKTRAPHLDDGIFGWVDLDIDAVLEKGLPIEEGRGLGGLRVATDFRPHSHHYLVMRDVRSSPTESGTLELAGTKLCGFMTTWGDGAWDVVRDVNARGELVRVRVIFDADRAP